MAISERAGGSLAVADNGTASTDSLSYFLNLLSERQRGVEGCDENRISDSSLRAYKGSLRRFMAWLSKRSKNVRNVTAKDLEDFKVWLLSRTPALAPATVNHYLGAIRKLYEILSWREGCPNPARNLAMVEEPQGFKKDALAEDQLRRLLGAIDRSTTAGKRDYALIALLITTGIRVAEAASADIGDLRRTDGGKYFICVKCKGHYKKDCYSELDSNTLSALLEYVGARGPFSLDDPLFVAEANRSRGKRLSVTSVSRIVRLALERIGARNERTTPHSLRHSAITMVLKARGPAAARDFAHHRSWSGLTTYGHVDWGHINLWGYTETPSKRGDAERRIAATLFGEAADAP